MAIGGRKPKPTSLKVLTGNPGKRKIPKEPKMEPLKEDAPEWLPEEAQVLWKRLRPELEKLGLLSSADGLAFEMMLTHYILAKEAARQLVRDGVLKEGWRGGERKHPAHQVLRDNSAALRQYLTEFGMTPSSRTRLGSLKEDEPDPFEEFLKHGTKPS